MEEWSLDDEAAPASSPAPRASGGGWVLPALGAALALVAGFLLWRPDVPDAAPTPRPTLDSALGSHLLAPVRLGLPAGSVATANGRYVGVQAPGGSLLITVPTSVAEPDSTRRPLPADPVAWLESHPDVLVSGVRTVRVAGGTATQLDYRRSVDALPRSEFARLPLFCGIGDEGTDCTRITSSARVRATFVRVGARTVLVEAVWRGAPVTPDGPVAAASLTGPVMPAELRAAYRGLLSTLWRADPT